MRSITASVDLTKGTSPSVQTATDVPQPVNPSKSNRLMSEFMRRALNGRARESNFCVVGYSIGSTSVNRRFIVRNLTSQWNYREHSKDRLRKKHYSDLG